MGTAVVKLVNSARNISTKQFKNEQDFHLSIDILLLRKSEKIFRVKKRVEFRMMSKDFSF